MLGLTPAQIRSYATQGFLTPERGTRGEMRFGFHDLVILRTAEELSAAQIPQRKVRRVLQRLREQLPEGRALTGVRIAADGERVVVRDGEAMWNPESGQSLFDFSVSEIEARTAVIEPHVESGELDADGWYDVACEVGDVIPRSGEGSLRTTAEARSRSRRRAREPRPAPARGWSAGRRRKALPPGARARSGARDRRLQSRRRARRPRTSARSDRGVRARHRARSVKCRRALQPRRAVRAAREQGGRSETSEDGNG